MIQHAPILVKESVSKEDCGEELISTMAEDEVRIISHQFQYNKLLHLLRMALRVCSDGVAVPKQQDLGAGTRLS